VTAEENRALLDTGATVQETVTLKESGTPGVFSAAFARTQDFLIAGTAATRREVADRFALPPESLRETALPTEQSQQVSLISVEGEIDSVMAEFLGRQVDRALSKETNTLVFEFDSNGGRLTETHDLAITISRLSDDNVRTIAWIPEEATGVAALVALACDEIYLAPGAKLGDIAVGDPAESDAESVRFVTSALTELSVTKDRPLAVMRAMAESNLPFVEVRHTETGAVTFMTDQERKVEGEEAWEVQRQVPESGRERLTLGGDLATELLVANAQVDSFEALQERLGLPLDVQPLRLEKTWVDDLVFALNRPEAVGLMFFIGIICIYLELHFTTGALGLLAALCFALFFWSKVMGGTAGQLEILLFLIGLICIGLEIFVLPGFGVFGVTGALLIIASLIMASQTFGNVEPNQDLYDAGKTFATFGASVLAVILMAAALSKFLPRIPFFNELILTPPGMNELQNPDEPRLKRELVVPTSEMVGQSGSALSMLRPSGKAVIGGKVVDVFSEGPLIAEGATIEVVAVSGNRITVRKIDPPAAQA
jgi:membrane-bound serine protease (ClpP class)